MDENRVLRIIDKIDKYLDELNSIIPKTYDEYEISISYKRACERLLQISLESVLDICNLLISSLKLGLPSDEEDGFKKLAAKKIISEKMRLKLIEMKKMRNVLVHRYGEIKDAEVYDSLTENLEDFETFKEEILKFLKRK
ncbi:hypothetical protein COU57_04135 [Candidatus Pacearchaeota archaeon CG10_big_fil_rev_8_21_14_0_10_32_14]|nr:MAG: hypothetical protein COU57_04135 [Candidatus Pacearchaeota archaeon CG10_big_fil_rev_8_21_14_0_10_32_14]